MAKVESDTWSGWWRAGGPGGGGPVAPVVYTVREFGGSILEFLFSELVDGMEAHALSPGADSALSVTCDLSREHIVGHYHPAKIYNPL